KAVLWAAAVLAVALLAPASSLAEPTAAEKETARKLMDYGDRMVEQKDLGGALKAYRLADGIMGVPTTGIEVANTEYTLGHLVEALEAAGKVIEFPKKPNEPNAFAQARREAEELAGKIALRIPTLRITVQGPPPGAPVEVAIDGERVPADALGAPRKVNPG